MEVVPTEAAEGKGLCPVCISPFTSNGISRKHLFPLLKLHVNMLRPGMAEMLKSKQTEQWSLCQMQKTKNSASSVPADVPTGTCLIRLGWELLTPALVDHLRCRIWCVGGLPPKRAGNLALGRHWYITGKIYLILSRGKVQII